MEHSFEEITKRAFKETTKRAFEETTKRAFEQTTGSAFEAAATKSLMFEPTSLFGTQFIVTRVSIILFFHRLQRLRQRPGVAGQQEAEEAVWSTVHRRTGVG